MPQDRRFMVETSGDTVIAVNLKCGFATLNHALIASNPAPAHAYSDDPLMDIERAKRVVMFVRDPPSRFKSFFRNWIVDKIPGTNANQTVYRNVSRFLRPADMKRLTETPAEERNTSEFLRFFTAAMGPALLQERHMAPQWHLLQKYGIAPDSITEIRNFRENTTFLESESRLDHAAGPADCEP